MTNKILSIDQCKELVTLGLDMSDASCFYHYDELCFNYSDKLNYDPDNGIIPTYTLQDILEKLPEIILGSTKQIKTVEFKLSIRGNRVYYMQDSFNQQWLKCIYGSTLLESAFNMLKWCLEHKYI